MRCYPFFIALVTGLSTAALPLSGVVVSAQETNVAEEATEQATEAQDAASDSASDSSSTVSDTADQATDEVSDTASGENGAAESASSNESATDASEQAVQAGQIQTPSPSAGANTDINSQSRTGIQGSTGAETQLNNQGQATGTRLDGRAGPQSRVDADLNTNTGLNQSQLNTQQSGVQANDQLSTQAIDQRLGLQFDQSTRASNQGLTISTIQPNSLFHNSGLRQGDVLVSVDNRPFTNRAEFVRLITGYQQDRIPLVVMRNGQRQTVYFSRPADIVIHDHQSSQAILGVTFDSSKGGAAVVRTVTPNSPAEHAGLMTGDIITGLNGKPVLAAHEVVDMIGSMQPGQEVTIDYSRSQQPLRTETILAARAELHRHTVGYAPQPGMQAPPVPMNRSVVRENRTYRVQPTNPGDPDGDGIRLDGDGRVPRRALNRR